LKTEKIFKIAIVLWIQNIGMWSSSLFMGNFVGPTVSGFVVENLGFR